MFTVHYQSKDQEERSVRVGKVMFGTGRKPNTRGIGLEVRCAACAATLRASQAFHLVCALCSMPAALIHKSCQMQVLGRRI